LSEIKKYLFHYKRYGLLRYLSHLETTAMIERVLRRTGVHFEQTQGFHQRMKLSFGQALPTGIIDLSGLFVASSDRLSSIQELDFINLVNSVSPRGFEISSFEEMPKTFKLSKALSGYEFKLLFKTVPPSNMIDKALKVNDVWIVELYKPFNSSVPKNGEFGQYLTLRSKALLSEVQIDQSIGSR